MKEKIYCGHCVYLNKKYTSIVSFEYICTEISNAKYEDTWLIPVIDEEVQNPKIKNKNNNCKYYKQIEENND